MKLSPLPPLRAREEMLRILLDKEYGRVPPTPWEMSVGPETVLEKRLCAGEAVVSRADMTISTPLGAHTFPVGRLLHTDGRRHPFFVFLAINSDIPAFYYPAEEIAERGFDVLSFCYKDVTADDGDFASGLSGVLLPPALRGEDRPCGKIAIWAFAAMRVLDYALTLDSPDPARAAVLGHSRLGKTALLTGALDERFSYIFSNDSGCGGAALSRGNTGERIADIMRVFPFWFLPSFADCAPDNAPAEFDQHYLLAAAAPRHVYVASADMDAWACPSAEFAALRAASPAWEQGGKTGLVAPETLPPVPAGAPAVSWGEGDIGYHLRHGKHFLSRTDWNLYMDFIGRHG